MLRISEIKLPLHHAEAELRAAIQTRLVVPAEAIQSFSVFKLSFDARKAQILQVYSVDVVLADAQLEADLLQKLSDDPHIMATPDMAWYAPVQAPLHASSPTALRPVVVGFGPCGIFAALALAQMGFKPIVLERGKEVRERTQDTWGLWRKNVLNPESNVQFGEGGAGTFSDGKLYSQIKDPRYLGRKVMQELVLAGAPPEILYTAHPHIGTFKLVKVVEHIRARIIELGGEIRFQHRLEDIELAAITPATKNAPSHAAQTQLRSLSVLNQATGERYCLPTQHAILALGHSARDTFAMLYERGVAIEAKAFSIGFRVEHPQSVIDHARWGRHAGEAVLGAAAYKLVHHASNGRAVYSFCMCPGGTVVAAASEAGHVTTNGMSQYSRNERNANAAIVVGITPQDFAHFPGGALAGIALQRSLEARAFELGGRNYTAPAQLVGDFLARRASTQWGSVSPSYKPGVQLSDLSTALPDYAIAAMREAFPVFGRKIKGFDRADAILTGVETRTSSPIRIGRNADFHASNVRGLFPAGEGAGYAGGILSAGVDGIKVAEAVAKSIVN